MKVTGTSLAIVLALAVFTASSPVEAQPAGKMYRIGLFHVGLDHVPPSLDGLRDALKGLGYEEGKSVRLDFRNLADEAAANTTAREFVRERVDLIVAFENQTIRAAKAATSTIPVVFLHAADPVADGFVSSLARPGGNLTGFSGQGDLPAKHMEVFKELVPKLRRLLVLTDADPTTLHRVPEVRAAAATLKIELIERNVADGGDLERAFAGVKRDRIDGVFILSPKLATNFTSPILRLTAENRLPLDGAFRDWVKAGALFSYAPDYRAVGADSARYVDRILKGAKPADLPVQQVSRFELVVNKQTAKALGLTIPPSLLLRADQLID